MTELPYVVGVDLSLTATGLADSTARCGRVGQSGVTALPLDKRFYAIQQVASGIYQWIAQPRPDLVVIEGIEAHGAGNGGLSERTFLWWWLVSVYLTNGVPVLDVNPNKLKMYTTGRGNATKPDMVAAVAGWQRWPVGKDNNKADAAALCAIGLHLLGHPVECDRTEKQLKALDGLSIVVPDLAEEAEEVAHGEA